MKDLITEHFNGLTLEKWTILSFFALGYIVIYKYSFYATLGIPWYISSISPLQIVFGSIKLVFYIVVSFFISVFIILFVRALIKNIIIGCLVRVLFCLTLLWSLLITSLKPVLSLKYEFISNFFDLTYLQPFIFFMTLFFLIELIYICRELYVRENNTVVRELDKYRVINDLGLSISSKSLKVRHRLIDLNKITEGDEKRISKIFFLAFIFLLFVGAAVGNSEAIYIVDSKEKYLSSAKVKGGKEEWFVVDYVGDKVLLIQGENNKNNTFRIVEYKEIMSITSERYRDEIEEGMNNKLKNYLGLQEN